MIISLYSIAKLKLISDKDNTKKRKTMSLGQNDKKISSNAIKEIRSSANACPYIDFSVAYHHNNQYMTASFQHLRSVI